jgi:hypothetical protein
MYQMEMQRRPTACHNSQLLEGLFLGVSISMPKSETAQIAGLYLPDFGSVPENQVNQLLMLL